jgi:hypothetical protein
MVGFAPIRLTGFGGTFMFYGLRSDQAHFPVSLINRLNLCSIFNTSNRTIEPIFLQ